MSYRLKRGDYVRVRLDGEGDWTPAFVALASDTDPSSVMLVFDGAVRDGRGGFIAKGLPLTVDYGKEEATSLFGGAYEIEVAEEV
jgi:hypothetical protein